jgi:hypothetical protein
VRYYELWLDRINPIEVESETAKFVVLTNGRRMAKDAYSVIRPTFEECKAKAVERAHAKLERAKQELDRARSHLANMQALKEPQP